jgi:hypothetical protein
MPIFNYTKAKGTFESEESSSGFLISDVAVAQKAGTITMAAPIYNLTFKNLVGDSSAAAGRNNGYHDVLISLYDTAGTQHKVVIQRNGGTSIDTDGGTVGDQNAVSTSGDHNGATAVSIAHNTTAADIALEVAKKFAGLDSAKAFVYTAPTQVGSTTTYTVNIYSLDNGTLADAKSTLLETEGTDPAALESGSGIQVAALNGVNSNQGYTSGDAVISVTSLGQTGGESAGNTGEAAMGRSVSFVSSTGQEVASMLKANNTGAGDVNQYQNTYTLADPPADREGQRVLLINNNSYRYVLVTGASAIRAGTKVTLAPGSVAHLIWTGSKWVSMPTESASGLAYA